MERNGSGSIGLFEPDTGSLDTGGAFAPEDAVTQARNLAATLTPADTGAGGAGDAGGGSSTSGLGNLLDSIQKTADSFFSSAGDSNPMPEIPGPPPLPSAIQQAIDQIFGPPEVVTVNPATETGITTRPTPSGVADGITIAPTVTTNNIFTQVINWFSGGGTKGTANPQGGADTIDLSGGSFLTPTNGAPVENASRYGSSTFPLYYAQGQKLDAARSEPESGANSPGIAGFIRGLNLPGLSSIKNDKALIAATLAAPVLALVVLWLVGKVFRK